MDAQIHPLTRADGSSLFTMGESSYMAGVYGPQRVRRRNRFQQDKVTIRVSYRTKTGRRGGPQRRITEKELRLLLNEMVVRTLHPRTYIRVAVVEIYDQVSLLSAVANAVNAITLAAMDANVALLFQVAAVTCAVISKPVPDPDHPEVKFKTPDYVGDDYDIAIMPTHEQMTRVRCEMMFAFDNRKLDLMVTKSVGKCSPDQYMTCLDMARHTVEPVFTMYRDLTIARYEKLLPQPILL